MQARRSHSLTAAAVLLAAALTPDVRPVGGIWLEGSTPAEQMALYSGIEEAGFLTADVVAIGTIDCVDLEYLSTSEGNVWDESIDMAVERCLKGPESQRLTFQGTTPFSSLRVTFKEGERVLLVLHWGDDRFGRRLRAGGEIGKYVLDDTGLVVRKGIPVERLEQEIASLLEPRSPRHLFEQAEIVVVGTVIRREEAEGQADVRPPAARMQLVTLEVKEWLKGTAARDSLVIVPPAFVRGRTAWDFVEFTPGEDALVFLDRRPDGRYEVVGKHDGKHRMGDMTTRHVLQQIDRHGPGAPGDDSGAP